VPLVGYALVAIALEPPSTRDGLAVLLFFVRARCRAAPGPDERGRRHGDLHLECLRRRRRDPVRVAVLPTLFVGVAPHADSTRLTLLVLLGSSLYVVANVVVVAGAISLSNDLPYKTVILPGLRTAGASFAIMSLLAALAANLWVINSWLLVLLTGPLFTLTLYQRSTLNSRIAARDARTDNLAGLGNHRAYQAALRHLIDDAERTGDPFCLCLVDVDNFKHINDTYGHPAGDEALVQLSKLLASIGDGAAFRFGGDEFAVLIATDELSAYREVERIQRELSKYPVSAEGPIAISVGIATFATHAADAPAAAHGGRCALLVEGAR
jgi:diguanylate cyclase (GGDEF)-like protein